MKDIECYQTEASPRPYFRVGSDTTIRPQVRSTNNPVPVGSPPLLDWGTGFLIHAPETPAYPMLPASYGNKWLELLFLARMDHF